MKSRTKLEKVIAAYNDLAEQLEKLGHPTLVQFAAGWRVSHAKYEGLLAEGTSASLLIKGLDQGLSELPSILFGLPPDRQERALAIYFSVLTQEYPEFFERQKLAITRIRERGKIKSEHEYHLVRAFIDGLRSDARNPADDQLSGMAVEYATAPRQKRGSSTR